MARCLVPELLELDVSNVTPALPCHTLIPGHYNARF